MSVPGGGRAGKRGEVHLRGRRPHKHPTIQRGALGDCACATPPLDSNRGSFLQQHDKNRGHAFSNASPNSVSSLLAAGGMRCQPSGQERINKKTFCLFLDEQEARRGYKDKTAHNGNI